MIVRLLNLSTVNGVFDYYYYYYKFIFTISLCVQLYKAYVYGISNVNLFYL